MSWTRTVGSYARGGCLGGAISASFGSESLRAVPKETHFSSGTVKELPPTDGIVTSTFPAAVPSWDARYTMPS